MTSILSRSAFFPSFRRVAVHVPVLCLFVATGPAVAQRAPLADRLEAFATPGSDPLRAPYTKTRAVHNVA